ncbi:MAG: hypothetical protein WCC69_07245 [Pirellulales bacterium]
MKGMVVDDPDLRVVREGERPTRVAPSFALRGDTERGEPHPAGDGPVGRLPWRAARVRPRRIAATKSPVVNGSSAAMSRSDSAFAATSSMAASSRLLAAGSGAGLSSTASQ